MIRVAKYNVFSIIYYEALDPVPFDLGSCTPLTVASTKPQMQQYCVCGFDPVYLMR
jgi:hypothetical protein